MESQPEITQLSGAPRIGLISDSHFRRGERWLPASLRDAFRGLDLILHLGDCGEAAALDELQELAPVLATRGMDDAADDRRYAAARVVELGGLRLGAIFDVKHLGVGVEGGALASFPSGSLRDALAEAFGAAIDVVAFAATHHELVALHAGVLWVNPGSPTLPAKARPQTLGTVAVVGARDGVASVEVIELR